MVFIGAGAFWIAKSSGMQMWDGFAPASGFLPLVFGILLAVLAVAATVVDVVSKNDDAAPRDPIKRPVLVLLTLLAGVLGIEFVGFLVSMFLMMFLLFRVTEGLPLLASTATAAGSAIVLTTVFRTWLGVPLPAGPWGF